MNLETKLTRIWLTRMYMHNMHVHTLSYLCQGNYILIYHLAILDTFDCFTLKQWPVQTSGEEGVPNTVHEHEWFMPMYFAFAVQSNNLIYCPSCTTTAQWIIFFKYSDIKVLNGHESDFLPGKEIWNFF